MKVTAILKNAKTVKCGCRDRAGIVMMNEYAGFVLEGKNIYLLDNGSVLQLTMAPAINAPWLPSKSSKR